jgi:hypothetical protein
MRMQRQKVKGTGHKQPADAQTEPNFYSMPSSQALPPDFPPSRAAAGPIISSSHQTPRYDAVSPGLEGVHDAAALLKNIAAGAQFSLGPSATPASSSEASESSHVAQSAQQTAAAAPHSDPSSPTENNRTAALQRHQTLPTLLPSPPSGPPSMSLLGRIAQTRMTSGAVPSSPPLNPSSSPPQQQQQSVFFWPSIRQPHLPILKESSSSQSETFDGSAENKAQQPTTSTEDSAAKEVTSLSGGDPQPVIPSTLQKGGDTSNTEESALSKETTPPPEEDKPKSSSEFDTQCSKGEDIVLPAITKYPSAVEIHTPPSTHPTTPLPSSKDPPPAATITSAIVNGIETEEV